MGILTSILSTNAAAQPFENFHELANESWHNIPAEELAPPIQNAIELIKTTTPELADIFDNSILSVQTLDTSSRITASAMFVTVGDNNDIPVIVLYNNPKDQEFKHSYVEMMSGDKNTTPTLEEFLTVNTAIVIANEAAHLRQFQADNQLFQTTLTPENENFCADKIALEASSNELTVAVALRLHEHFKTLPPGQTTRMNNALDGALYFMGFENFTQYAKDPQNSPNKQAYDDARNQHYAKINNCDPNNIGTASQDVKRATNNAIIP